MYPEPDRPQSSEPIDVLDGDGNPSGAVKPRWQIHRDGDWHRAFHLWLLRPDGTVLLQRRSLHKDLEPGKVDVTVGGHLAAGESVYAGIREVQEELGVDVSPTDLVALGTWRSERTYPGVVDREFQHAFLLVDDRPVEEYVLDCLEVYLLYEVPLARLIELYRHGAPLPAPGFDCQRRRNDALLIADDLIEQSRPVALAQLEAAAAWLEENVQGS